MLWLTAADVAPLLDLDRAMDVTEAAFREQAAGAVASLAAGMLRTRKGMLRTVTGALLDSRRMGVRVGPAIGYASQDTITALYDSESGELLSLMVSPFGTLRTGAVIGLATRLLARQDAHVLGLLGSGRNALSLLAAVCHVRPIEQVNVFSPNEAHRREFAARAAAELGRPVQAVGDAGAAALHADVVCVATNSLVPVLAQVSPGTFVATMGRPSEIDPQLYLSADLVLAGNLGQEEGYFDAKKYPHQLLNLVKAGKLHVHELHEVITGALPGRTSPDQTIVFKESQGGYGDVAFCSYVYDEARKRGLGQELSL